MTRSRRFFLSIISSLMIFAPLLLYHNMFDNPFIHDDFFWLDSGKKISDWDFSGIFTLIAGRYCPAFIHLLFGACFKMLGLNYTWYHVISLSIHVINGTLLYILIYLLFHDHLWALLAAFFFAINPVVSNAILWPSAWVDLFAASGLLATLIFYKLFLDKGLKWLYALAFFSFMVSIFSKVVGIGLPVLLLFLEIVMISSFDNKALKQVSKRVSPFFLASLLYLIPIVQGLFTGPSGQPSEIIYNAFRYIPALFLPERYLMPKTFIILRAYP